jgi:hypothetical protein
MAVDEVGRLRLHRRLEEVLGSDEAEVLMAHLPLYGRDDVATNGDIDRLVERLDHGFELVDQRLGAARGDIEHLAVQMDERLRSTRSDLSAEFHRSLYSSSRAMFLGLAGLTIAFSSAVITAIRLH